MRSVAKHRRLTLDDILRVKLVTDAQVAPDGRSVAFVVADNHKEGPSGVVRSEIWMQDIDEGGRPSGNSRLFTSGGRNDLSPRWSPDSSRLAFLSNRGGRFQVYAIDRHGGEAIRLTEEEGLIGPDAFGLVSNPLVWSGDGREIAFLMQDPPSLSEREEQRRSGDALRFEQDPRFFRIRSIDLKRREVTTRSPENLQVWEFDWSRDGREFAAIVSADPYEWSWFNAKLATIDSGSGRTKVLYDPHPRQIARPFWSLDSSSVYFLSSVWSDRGLAVGDLFVVPSRRRSRRPTDITKGYRGSVGWMAWLSEKELLLSSVEGMKALLYTVRSGDARPRLEKVWEGGATFCPGYVPKFSVSRSGKVVAVAGESFKEPPEAWVGRRTPEVGMEWAQVSRANASLLGLDLPDVKSVRWRSFDGREIEGLLVTPLPTRKVRGGLPMAVLIHGGPTIAFRNVYYLSNYSQPAYILASRGFAVFMPNPRGSTGRGLGFAEANVGEMGGGDFQDIMTGVDHIISLGGIDRKRLYITGHSYGGYITAWAVTQTDRFRAAAVLAGISDWLSYHGTAGIPSWDSSHYRSDPYSQKNVQARFSPINFVGRVRTPTLIVVGENDWYCPPDQSREFFRALKDRGVETELDIVPREGHGFTEKAHILHTARRVLAWFESH